MKHFQRVNIFFNLMINLIIQDMKIIYIPMKYLILHYDELDLYSEPQTINVIDDNKETDTYKLKFTIITYNQEIIYIHHIVDESLDCKKNNKELICHIKKHYLIGNSSPRVLEMKKLLPIIYFNKDGKINSLYLIPPIIINYDVQKINVIVKITKLLTNYVEKDNCIAFETNITNIPTILTDIFELEFDEKEKIICLFKSGLNGILLLLCNIREEGTLLLKKIKMNIY